MAERAKSEPLRAVMLALERAVLGSGREVRRLRVRVEQLEREAAAINAGVVVLASLAGGRPR